MTLADLKAVATPDFAETRRPQLVLTEIRCLEKVRLKLELKVGVKLVLLFPIVSRKP